MLKISKTLSQIALKVTLVFHFFRVRKELVKLNFHRTCFEYTRSRPLQTLFCAKCCNFVAAENLVTVTLKLDEQIQNN